jgi:serine/threonine-protein kinase RsbW
MAGDYSLTGLAVPESLNLLQDLLAQVGRDHPDLGQEDLSMFETAIVEIHGNVIEHGRPKGKVVYAFELDVLDDRLVGQLRDTGEPVPDLSELVAVDEMDETGRGLWLARATLDELHYSRRDGHNHWSLVRLRQPVDGASS